MQLRLLVIRTADIARLAEFYSLLGLRFEYHQHDKGPFHYAAQLEEMTLEIYPLSAAQTQADAHLRLGFTLDNFEQTIQILQDNAVHFISLPQETQYGYMAIVKDPDGRKIELYNP